MDKQKEIEEMVEIARKHGQKVFQETESYADIYDDMTAVYEAGYRKADEVRKETVKEITDFLRKRADTLNSLFKMNTMMLDELAEEIEKKFCVEVDE